MGHPHRERKYRWSRLKLTIFGQCLAISQKRCKIETYLLRKADNNYHRRLIETVYALCRLVLFPVTLSDPMATPKTTLFYIVRRLSFLCRVRDVKFRTQVAHSRPYLMTTNGPERGVWLGSRDQFYRVTLRGICCGHVSVCASVTS